MDGDRRASTLAVFSRGLLVSNGILLVPLAALLASSVRLVRGVSCGHDFEFHLISWLETQRDWSQGVLYPHWAQSPNWDAGEARFVFYPPLTWMLGALLGSVLSWEWVPFALTFLSLTAAGLSVRALARSFLDGPTATLAGVLAAATPYGLFTAYERTAFSELAAAAWIPLVLLFAWKGCSREGLPARRTLCFAFDGALNGSAAPLAAVLAGAWLTNAPTGVMASYLLLFAVIVVAIVRREWWPIVRGAVAAIVAFGLIAFYLVPAAWEQRWIAIRQAVDVGMRVSDSWLFARHASSDLALHDEVLRFASTILVLTTLLGAAGVIAAWRRNRLPEAGRAVWIAMALLIPVILLLQFPVSAPVWKLLPKLEFLQFPWRWLTVLGAPYAIFLAAAMRLETRRDKMWSAALWILVLALFTGSAARLFFQSCDAEDAVSNQIAVFRTGTGVEGTDEYAAAGSDNSLIASGLPDGCLVSDPKQELGESQTGETPAWYPEQGSCDDTYQAQTWQNEYKALQFDSDHEGYVVLRLSRYPAWQVTVNGKAAETLPDRDDGLIAVPVSEGHTAIEVRWSTTPDVLWGRWISLASLLLLLALWLAERQLRFRHL